MGRRLPEHVANRIVTHLTCDRPIKKIVACGLASKTTIYKIRLNVDLWGTPYPPSTVRLGRPKLLALGQELVIARCV
jgi:hypothetical protein